jgi:hypothetical protein
LPVSRAEEVGVARSSLRSLRSAALAVGATGVLSISIPLALLLGTGTFESTAVLQPSSVLETRMVTCGAEQPIRSQVVRAGQCVLVQASGFTGREMVRVHRLGDTGWSDVVQADATGRMTYRYQLPRTARTGPEVLSFVGQSVPSTSQSVSGFVDPETPQVAFCRLSVTGA